MNSIMKEQKASMENIMSSMMGSLMSSIMYDTWSMDNIIISMGSMK